MAAAQVVVATKVFIEQSGRSANSFADDAGIDRGTLSRVLAGHNLPDLRTLYALETTVGRTLWRASP